MIPKEILMIRPRHFGYNPETAASNKFQQPSEIENAAQLALDEFDAMVDQLRKNGVIVRVENDREDVVSPDAVFPNNWLAVIPGGTLILFPMMAPSRRNEINRELVNELMAEKKYPRKIDLTERAGKGEFLEGTGSVVFDHAHRVAYACSSPRTDLKLLSELCREIEYTPVSFHAGDINGQEIYHTNVMMSVGKNKVVLCSEAIEDAMERSILTARIASTGKELIEISHRQMAAFAGNVFQVQAGDHPVWIMSETAFRGFTDAQRKSLESDGGICAVRISTIEQLGGGSARCMIAGLY